MVYRCLLIASVLPVAACTTDALGLGSGSDTVITPRLLRTDVPAARRISQLAPHIPSGPFYSSDLRITSLRAPLMAIELEGDHHGTVYRCSGATPDECLIDLAGGSALADLLHGEAAAVEPGTYTRIRMYTCNDVGYRGYLTAEVTLDGQTYITDPASSSGMSPVADADDQAGEVSVEYSGCAMHYDLPVPLTIGEGDALDLKLYFDMKSIAWASLGDSQTPNAWLPGGCTSAAGDEGPFACMAYPNVAATIDAAPPTVEHYLVNGLATFGMFFDSQDRFFGGYTRRTYVEGDAHVGVRGVGADTPLKRLETRDGGMFHVENYGSAAEGPGYFATDDFQRVAPGESFAGSFAENGSGSYPYTAQRLD